MQHSFRDESRGLIYEAHIRNFSTTRSFYSVWED